MSTVGHKLITDYPGKIPIIVQYPDFIVSDTVREQNKKNFLVPDNITITALITILRNQLKISSNETIYLMINGVLPCHTELLSQIYAKHKDLNNNCLYVTIAKENTFGK